MISKLGYDADDVKASAEGIAKLDGCKIIWLASPKEIIGKLL